MEAMKWACLILPAVHSPGAATNITKQKSNAVKKDWQQSLWRFCRRNKHKALSCFDWFGASAFFQMWLSARGRETHYLQAQGCIMFSSISKGSGTVLSGSYRSRRRSRTRTGTVGERTDRLRFKNEKSRLATSAAANAFWRAGMAIRSFYSRSFRRILNKQPRCKFAFTTWLLFYVLSWNVRRRLPECPP